MKKSGGKILSSVVGALLISATCLADTIAGTFNVNISLLARPGLCSNQSSANAVQVVCESPEFVNIVPQPSRTLVGVLGVDAQPGRANASVLRYLLRPGYMPTAQFSGVPDPFTGVGTVTEFRILNADDPDGPLEILISF